MAKNILYVEKPELWKKNFATKRFSDDKLEVKVIEHGIVLPARKIEVGYAGGVCDNDFNFIAGYTRNYADGKAQETKGGGRWCCLQSSYSVEREKFFQLDEDVLFGGTLMGHFGHFIMECWSRLWYVIQNPELKSKILFIVTAKGYHKFFDEFFRLMGIEAERIIYVKQPMQCRSVIVPDQAQYSSMTFMDEFLIPYRKIKSRITPGNHKKLYLTRTNFDEQFITRMNSGEKNIPVQGHCFNEKYFEDFFSARGYEIVSMEKLSLEDQISLIMGAEEIVTTLGTLSNWAIFAKPNLKLIVLNRTSEPLHFQFLVNAATNLSDFYVVDIGKSFMYAEHYSSACVLGSTKYWKKFVADYFGEQIEEDDDNPYLEETIDKYVDFWSKIYPQPQYAEHWISSLKNMCHKIVALESRIIKRRPLLRYMTHVSKEGWSSWKVESQLSNLLEQNDLQAIKINFVMHKVYYAVYFNETWSEEVISPNIAGTTGQEKSITGIKMRLDEEGAKKFDILYRVHKFDGEWTVWAKNDEELLSNGQKLNAIQIKLESKPQELSPSPK